MKFFKKLSTIAHVLFVILVVFAYSNISYIDNHYVSTPQIEKIALSSNIINTGIVTSTSLNIRNGASTSCSIIGKIKKGDAVQIYEATSGWYKIKFNLTVGYVSSNYISKTKNAAVKTLVLNLRSGPGTNQSIIGILKKNDVVTVLSKKENWTKVQYSNKIGWVYSSYLTNAPNEKSVEFVNTNKSAFVNVLSLNLRCGPGKTYSPIGVLFKNNEVNIISTDGDWSKVRFRAKVGWVLSKYITNKSQQTKPVIRKTIVIDAGHGGTDCGAIGPSNTMEADITLAVALKVGSILESKGHKVIYTRTSNYIPKTKSISENLQYRVDKVTANNADLFISIHNNSSSNSKANGLETYYYNQNSKNLADCIQSSILKNIHIDDRGVRTAPYYVLRKNQKLSVLVELGFISNPTEEKKLINASNQQKWATGIADGITNYLIK